MTVAVSITPIQCVVIHVAFGRIACINMTSTQILLQRLRKKQKELFRSV